MKRLFLLCIFAASPMAWAANWYVGSTKWTAVTAWAALTAYNVGDLRRQLAAPTVGNERVFRCTTAGTSSAAEPTWTLTVGGTTTDTTAVWTEVTGNNTYGWTAPHARLANSFASGWGAAGDTFYVSNNHAETQSTGITLTSPGTAASPCRVLCVVDSATPPTALSTTATVSSSGSGLTLSYAGFAYIYGVTFIVGTSGTCVHSFASTSPWWIRLEKCSLQISSSGVSSRINIGATSVSSDDSGLDFLDSTISLGATAQGIVVRCRFKWWGTASALLGTIPTTLFLTGTSGNSGPSDIIGVDLSAAGSGKNLVDIGQGNLNSYLFQDCKIGPSVSITTGNVAGQGGTEVLLINCDSTNSNYRFYRQTYQGTITHETTVVRTGGASDGSTTFSRKMVSTANSQYYSPLQSQPIEAWNEITNAAITVTIPVITDNVTLTDADAWVEVEYLGTATYPLGVYTTDRSADLLATPANQSTDSTSIWTTTGLTTPVKQSLSTSINPTFKGVIRARVMLAKATTTVYYDPKIISGFRQYPGSSATINEGTATVGLGFSN